MAWIIEFDKKAKKAFSKLDKSTQYQIDKFILKLAKTIEPRKQGAALQGVLKNLWKYRVGDHRLVCKIEDQTVTILVLQVGHRREVYKPK